jgi:PKD repeat protein
LRVSDGTFTINDTCKIWVNGPPIVNAGSDQNVTVNQIVNFDGSKSYDLTNDVLSYFWDFGNGNNTGWQSSSKAINTYNVSDFYTVTLKVTDGTFTINDTCKIWVNGPPIVNAGSDQNVNVNQIVYFDGSNSYDSTNDALSFKWDFGDDNSTAWQNSSDTSHVYNFSGLYIVTLKVTDGIFTIIDTCKVWVNGPPIARAGVDQNVSINQIVYFDGSKSHDLTNDALTFKWDFGDGSSTGWQKSSNTSHSFSKVGIYKVGLTVSDGLFTDIDYCVVNVTSPGGNTYLIFHPFITTITLYEDSDPIDNAIDLWDYVENDGFKEILNFTIISNTNPNCGLTLDSNRFIDIKPAANWHGNSNVTIQVSDGLMTDTQHLTIIVKPVNDPPIAYSGPDRNATVNQIVNFDGSGSYDIDGDDLTYKWNFGDGTSTAWMNNKDTSHSYTKEGIYTVTLTVRDNTHPPLLTGNDTCIIRVSDSYVNNPPIAVAGPNLNITVGQSVTLDGSGSYDPDGDTITYEWMSSLKGTLGIDAIIKDIKLDVGIHTITLKVSDGELTDTDTCIVRVSDISGNLPPVAKIRLSKDVQKGETASLSGDESYDEDGYITQYSWDFGDGVEESRNEAKINHIWDQFGSYKITLLVTDNEGATGITSITIFVTKSEGNDADGDGLPNDWEITYGLDPFDPSDAALDSDKDTLTNLEEYLLGTDPMKFDTDGDGVIDSTDAFPTDAAASIDADGDNYPDSWNPGKSEDDSTTGLKLDAHPNDPKRHTKETTEDNYLFILILIICVTIILLIFASLKLFVLKSKRQHGDKLHSEDEMLDKVKTKILSGESLKELEYSRNEIEDMLERTFKTGQISENTYNSIRSEILYSDGAEFDQLNNSFPKGGE